MGRLSPPPRRELLPGVGGPEKTRPQMMVDASAQIQAARRRAALRDLIDIAVLILVDVFFLSWPAARIPFLTRDGSLWVLLFLHVVIVTSWIRTRWYLRWRARRIALTWTDSERRHLRR